MRDFEGEAAGRRPSREALARQRKEEEAGSPWSEKERGERPVCVVILVYYSIVYRLDCSFFRFSARGCLFLSVDPYDT